jgi:tetratricopeptide (TPR) repeat protein
MPRRKRRRGDSGVESPQTATSRAAKSESSRRDQAAVLQGIRSFLSSDQAADLLLASLAVLTPLVVFLCTLAPTVTAEDSGELTAAAWHFGVPHPPGYPLWTILCGLFTHVLPAGSIAWRANLFSAVTASLAAGCVALALRELKVWRPACFAAAVCWILTRWSWTQSVITEVYGLNSLLTAALLWCALRWYATRRPRPLLIASLLFGLGMGNHHTIALAALALIVWILAQQPALLRRGELILAAAGLFTAGLLPYAYLPIRAAADPPVNWGNPTIDMSTDRPLKPFLNHVTRAQYGAIGPMATPEPRSFPRFLKQVRYLATSYVDDLTWPLVLLGAAGWLVVLLRRRSFALLLALWIICTGLLFAWLANYDFDRTSAFAMRVFLIPVPLAGTLGIAFLLDALYRRISPAALQDNVGPKSSAALEDNPPVPPARSNDPSDPPSESPRQVPASRATLALAVVSVALPAILLIAHWRDCDYSNYYYAEDHAQNLLDCMLPEAMIIPTGDHSTFPLVYEVLVQENRSDVLIADIYGYLRHDLYADQPEDSPIAPETWVVTQQRRPVYYTTKRRPPVSTASLVPAGLLYHLLPNHFEFEPPNPAIMDRYRNLSDPTVLDLGAAHILCNRLFFKGLHALQQRRIDDALAEFRKCSEMGEGLKEVFNNLGSALAEHGQPAEALSYFEEAARLDRHYVMPRWNLFRVYQRLQRYDDAREMLENLIELTPEDHRPHREMGLLLAGPLASPQEALPYWQRSLELNPNQPDLRAAVDQLTQQRTGPERQPAPPAP